LLSLIAFFSEILSIIFFLCFLNRNKGEGLWVIFFYCIFSVVTENAAFLLRGKMDRVYLYAAFTICEYTIFAYFFYLSFKKKRIAYVPIVGTVIFYLIAGIYFTNKNSAGFDSLTASVEAILIIIYSLVFLYDQIRHTLITYVYNTKKFWIVIAFFLYFSSTLFLFLFAATFTKQEHSYYWVINNFFEILKNALFCVSFAMKKDNNEKNIFHSLNPDIL